MKRALAMATLVLVVATPAAGQEGDGVVVESSRQVTGGPNPVRLFDIPALTVDPDDPSTVVMAVGDARTGGCGLRVSRDGGLSWATTADTLLPEDQPFCIQLALGNVMAPAFGSDGALHVAMPVSSADTGHPNGPISMVVANSDDLGITHDTVTVAESQRITFDPADFGGEGEPEEANTWHKFPSLVVDPEDPDRLFLGWRWYVWGLDLQGPEGDVPFRPYTAVSEDGGKTWTDPVDMVEATSSGEEVYGASAPMMEVGPDGALYGFSKELPRDSDQKPRVIMFKSTDDGQSWEASVVADGGDRLQASPESGIDPETGQLYVTYATGGPRPEGDEAPSPQEVFMTTSGDGGESWSGPVLISDDTDAPGKGADKFYPQVSVAPNGRVDVAWHDFRNDPFGPGQIESSYRGERYWDVYMTSSTDRGVTWARNRRVTKTSIDGGEGATFNNIDTRGPIGLVSTDDLAYVAWSDTRATGSQGDAEDAYFTRVRFDSPPGEVGGDGGDSDTPAVVWVALGAGAALGVAGLALVAGTRRGRAGPPTPPAAGA